MWRFSGSLFGKADEEQVYVSNIGWMENGEDVLIYLVFFVKLEQESMGCVQNIFSRCKEGCFSIVKCNNVSRPLVS